MVPGGGGSGWLGRRLEGLALDGRSVGVFDGTQPSGYPGLTGDDGLTVAPTVGACGEALAELLDFADVGFAFIDVGCYEEDGGGGIEDERYPLAVRISVGQGGDFGSLDVWPCLAEEGLAVPGPVTEPGEHGVDAVDLVAGGGEILADRAEFGAAGRRSSTWAGRPGAG